MTLLSILSLLATSSSSMGAQLIRWLSPPSAFPLSQDTKAALKRARSLANDLASRVNEAKGRIDSAMAQLQHQQEQQQGRERERNEGVAGEQEEKEEEEEANVKRVLLAQLKRRKREYRRLFALLAKAKADLHDLQQSKQQVTK